MAIPFFDHISYTTFTIDFAPGITAGLQRFTAATDELDLVTPRTLVGYNLLGFYLATFPPPAKTKSLDHCSALMTINQPLNQSKFPALSVSVPAGASLSGDTNQIRLLGNGGAVSIFPMDITKFTLSFILSDQNGDVAGSTVQCITTLFWDVPKTRFAGDPKP